MPMNYKETDDGKPIDFARPQKFESDAVPLTEGKYNVDFEAPTIDMQGPAITILEDEWSRKPPPTPEIVLPKKEVAAQESPLPPQKSVFTGDLMSAEEYKRRLDDIEFEKPTPKTLPPIPLWVNLFMLTRDTALGKADWIEFILGARPRMSAQLKEQEKLEAVEIEKNRLNKKDLLTRQYQSDVQQQSQRERALGAHKGALVSELSRLDNELQNLYIMDSAIEKKKAVKVLRADGELETKVYSDEDRAFLKQRNTEKRKRLLWERKNAYNELRTYANVDTYKDMSWLEGSSLVQPQTQKIAGSWADKYEQTNK